MSNSKESTCRVDIPFQVVETTMSTLSLSQHCISFKNSACTIAGVYLLASSLILTEKIQFFLRFLASVESTKSFSGFSPSISMYEKRNSSEKFPLLANAVYAHRQQHEGEKMI
jgi:hypothetical protein